jgi:acyl-ACP thioesterase
MERHHKIGLFDVDHAFKLRLQSAARFFQESATAHSTQVGAGTKFLFDQGLVWLLHRLEIEVVRYPLLGEEIRVITWSRGFKGFKAFRDYCILSGEGEEIARGSSVWLFFDVNRKRVSKVQPQISSRYTVEKEACFDREVDAWQTCGEIEPEQQIQISLRYSDFDVNGHVNNTIYMGFLETLYHRTIRNNDQGIKNVKIRFCREIARGTEQIQSGWRKANGVYHCNIFEGSTLYADAEMVPMA